MKGFVSDIWDLGLDSEGEAKELQVKMPALVKGYILKIQYFVCFIEYYSNSTLDLSRFLKR